MSKTYCTDTQIVADIKLGGSALDRALKCLYQRQSLINRIIQFVKTNKGDTEQAKDIFQDCILLLIRKIENDQFELTGSLDGFIYSTSRFTWLRRQRKEGRETATENPAELDKRTDATPEELLLTDERKKVLFKVLDSLGARCRQVLELWMLSYSMKEIAEIMDFSSDKMARKTKFNCFRKLKEIFRDNPGFWK